MPRYVAFLRAINVGGHVVKMDRLRALFDELRFRNVETFIASGNVLFDSSSQDTEAMERKIEKHLEKALGYEVVTFVRRMTDLAAVVSGHPFVDVESNGHTLSVGFLKQPLRADVPRLEALVRPAVAAYNRGDIDSQTYLTLSQNALSRRADLDDKELAARLAEISLETALFLPPAESRAPP